MEGRIHLELDVPATPEAVWRLLTDPAAIPRWWEGVSAVDGAPFETGRTVELRYGEGRPDACEVLEVEPASRLVYRWTSSEPEPTLVTFALTAVPGGTRLAFTNEGYGEGAAWERFHAMNFQGWLGMLLKLRGLAVAGVRGI